MALTASPLRRSARRWTCWRPSSERATPVAPEKRSSAVSWVAPWRTKYRRVSIASGGTRGGLVLVPETKPPEDRVRVGPESHVRGQARQLLRLPAPQHHVVGLQAVLQQLHHPLDVALPLLAAHALEAAQSQVVLVGTVLSVGEMGQLERLQDAVAHEGGAEPGAEAEIEHASA